MVVIAMAELAAKQAEIAIVNLKKFFVFFIAPSNRIIRLEFDCSYRMILAQTSQKIYRTIIIEDNHLTYRLSNRTEARRPVV